MPDDAAQVLGAAIEASPADAQTALREFFGAVLEKDGHGELTRIYEAFYFECHKEYPPVQADWRDYSSDGNLSAGPGTFKTASNGK